MPKKWVLFALLTFTFVLLFIHFILQSGFISEKAKRYSEAGAERLLGQKVKIDQVQLRLLSASVSLKEIASESKPAGAPPLFRAEEVRIFFNPWSLLTQVFIIRKIVVENPSLTLSPEIIGEKAPFLTRGGAEKSSPVVTRLIRIRNGALTYRGEGVVQNLSLAGLDAEIKPDLRMRRFDIEISGGKGLLSWERGEKKIDRLEAKVVVLPDQIEMKKVTIASDRSTFSTEGTLRAGQPVDLRIEGRFPLEEIGMPPIRLFSEEKRLSGEVTAWGRLTGSFPQVALTGKISLPHLFANGIEIGSLASDVSYRNQNVRFGALSGALFSGTFSGEAEGAFSGQTPEYRLALQFKQLSVEKAKKALARSEEEIDQAIGGIFLEGNLTLSGKGAEAKNIGAEGRVALKRLPLFSSPFPTKAERSTRLIALFQEGETIWEWNGERLIIDRGTARFPGIESAFHGSWGTEEGFTLETTLQGEETRSVAEALRVPLSGAARLEGTLSGKGDRFWVKGRAALQNWTLQGQPFGPLSSEFTYRERRLLLKQGTLQAAAGTRKKNAPPPYRFEGMIDFKTPQSPAFDFRVEIASGDPQETLAFFKQSIPLQTRATGRLFIKGTPERFSVKGPLVLERGVLYGERFDRGSLELTVTRQFVSLQKVILETENQRVEGEGEIHYRGTFRVALKAPRFKPEETNFFRARAPLLAADAAVELAGEGSFQKPHLKMIAAVENLRYGETETGRGTVRGAWDEKTLEMEGDFPDREMSFKGTLGLSPAYPFSVQTRVQRLRLDPFFKDRLTGPLAKLSLLLSGQVEANGLLSEIEKTSGSVSVAELLADFGGYPVQNDGPFTLRSEQGAWAFENARFKGDNTLLEFNGGLTLLKRWDLFVKGEADLNLIKFLTKEITHGKGMASLDLRISDQWSAPRVRGELTLQDGVVRTKTLSQTIHISTLAAVFNEQRLLLETLEGEMGRGKFRASGKADLEGFGLGRFGFLLELFDARVNLFPDLAASVEGELFFQGSESGKTIKGELTLKKAVYEKKIDLKSAVLELQKKKEEDFSSEIPLVGAAEMNVHIYGKESIWIDNNVAKIPLEIDLFLKGTVDRPLLIGRIDIPRGSVYFRRNDFKVTSGSVEFLNPEKTDPVFNVQAKTEVKRQDKTFAIDLGLSGRLSQFTLSLVSSPPLPETDILSLLTFGKTAQEIAEDTKGGAGGEVTSFVVSELLEEPVQKITGVDRIQVDPYTSGSKSSSGTRLTAEKWLMEDRLRVTYSTSFDPSEEEVLRMIYELNKNISLVGEKDEKGQIGGDIRFRFEFR